MGASLLAVAKYMLSTIEKYHQISSSGPWSATYDLSVNYTSQNKRGRALFSKNVLKIVPIRVYKFSFLYVSKRHRVFCNYFRPL